MKKEKPAANTILNGSRLDIADFSGVIHRLVGTWTESSVQSAAFVAVSFDGAVRGDSLKSNCFKNILHITSHTEGELDYLVP